MLAYIDNPDPWPDDPDDDWFDSTRPRYADVPLIRRDGSTFTVVRGQVDNLPEVIAAIEADRNDQHHRRPAGFDGNGIWGVFAGPFGFSVCPDRSERTNDHRWELRLDDLFDEFTRPLGHAIVGKLDQLQQLLVRAEQLGWGLTSSSFDLIRLVNPNYNS